MKIETFIEGVQASLWEQVREEVLSRAVKKVSDRICNEKTERLVTSPPSKEIEDILDSYIPNLCYAEGIVKNAVAYCLNRFIDNLCESYEEKVRPSWYAGGRKLSKEELLLSPENRLDLVLKESKDGLNADKIADLANISPDDLDEINARMEELRAHSH